MSNIFINLPKPGNWVVAAEWFDVYTYTDTTKPMPSKLDLGPSLTVQPLFAGADRVNVQGVTPFTLAMGEFFNTGEGVCYNGNLTDNTNCDSYPTYDWVDLYSFDTDALSSSVTSSTGDIQAQWDSTSNSTVLGSLSNANIYAYVGNGDLVNYPMIPSNATFYATTALAKAAVVGAASAAIVQNDIFAVKVPSTNGMAWVQIWLTNQMNSSQGNCVATTASSLMQFWFIYNKEGVNYMKFDETTYGHTNCNQNTYIAPPAPTPTQYIS